MRRRVGIGLPRQPASPVSRSELAVVAQTAPFAPWSGSCTRLHSRNADFRREYRLLSPGPVFDSRFCTCGEGRHHGAMVGTGLAKSAAHGTSSSLPWAASSPCRRPFLYEAQPAVGRDAFGARRRYVHAMASAARRLHPQGFVAPHARDHRARGAPTATVAIRGELRSVTGVLARGARTVAEPRQREAQTNKEIVAARRRAVPSKGNRNMRKLAIRAGLAGASIMALTGQALAFPGGTQWVTARIAPEVQAVQYNGHRPRQPRHYNRPPYSGGAYFDGSQSMRYFNGQWANGCFNLPYLSAVDACGGFGGRR